MTSKKNEENPPVLKMPWLSENTKVSISLALLISLFGVIAIGAYTVGNVLTKYEERITHVELSAIEKEADIDDDIESLSVEVDKNHSTVTARIDSHDARLAGQDVSLVEIKTELRWILAGQDEIKTVLEDIRNAR
jgi:hypothetical protein